MGLAEEIRHFVSEHYIKPAKERGETKLVVVSGEVHGRIGLKDRSAHAVSEKMVRDSATLRAREPHETVVATAFYRYAERFKSKLDGVPLRTVGQLEQLF